MESEVIIGLDTTNQLERLERRQVEMEVRKADRGVSVTVRDREKRIAALEKRAPRR